MKVFTTQHGQNVKVEGLFAEVNIEWKDKIITVKVLKNKVPHVKQYKWHYTQRHDKKGRVKHCLGYINPTNPKNSKPSLVKEFFGFECAVEEVKPNYFDLTIYER